MIEFNLFEFFGILGVGTFAILSAIYFIFEYQRLFNTKKHNENAFYKWLKQVLKSNYRDSLLIVVAAVSVYSAGILAQDITDKLTDTADNTNLARKLPFIKKLLPNEGKLRVESLVKSDTSLTHLGGEVFDSAHKIMNTPKNGLPFMNNSSIKADSFWRKEGRYIMDSIRKWDPKPKFVDFVNGIYYTSKNWCYLRSGPVRSELEGIQERIDFSRSLLLIAYLNSLLLILFYLVYYIPEFRKGKKNRFIVCNPGAFEIPFKKIFYPTALLICAFIILITRIGYIAAEKNFNERAMGYYVSQFKYPVENDGSNMAAKQEIKDTASKK